METYLVRLSGDVTYRKQSSRFYFERLVAKNIAMALKKAKVIHEPARIFVKGENIDSKILSRIFGVSSYSKCSELEFENLEDLVSKIEEIYKEKVMGKSFAIKCRRSGIHDFNSMDVAKLLGSRLIKYAKKVDLENPELKINIEIRNNKAYVYEEIEKGPSGLPIGIGEHVLSLFSGGFDSPVASWFVAKRGCLVDFLHFAFGGLSDVKPVFDTAKYLSDNWFYGYKPKFYIVRFSEIIKEIMSKLPNPIWQIALRRTMYLAAEKLAIEKGHEALVTGEALSQATSQTIRNLRIAEQGINLPLIRPLIGFDKHEIIGKSKEIGTYEFSLKVEELCGVAIGPLTARANIEKFFSEFQSFDLNLIDKALKELIEIKIDEDPEKIKEIFKEEEFVIDYIPKGSIIVNLMPEKMKIENSITFEDFDAEKFKDSLVIFVCKKGLTSKGIASYYRKEGIKAYSLAGGFEGYKRILSKL